MSKEAKPPLQLARNFIEKAFLTKRARREAPDSTLMKFYHNYSVFDLSVPQKDGIYAPNQASKGPIISGYLLFALGKLKAKQNGPVSTIEMFCADAYFSFLARKFGADHCIATDNDRDGHFAEAASIKEKLGYGEEVTFLKSDIFDLPKGLSANIVINCGGLYHLSEPLRALDLSYSLATDYLIVQTVVSLASSDKNYFETPAPGWTWGSRFSHEYLLAAIQERGWNIVDVDRNELLGNDKPQDRGSSYFLISKT